MDQLPTPSWLASFWRDYAITQDHGVATVTCRRCGYFDRISFNHPPYVPWWKTKLARHAEACREEALRRELPRPARKRRKPKLQSK